ncbi:hypothetical protein NA2_19813 [Nitratireductor pacificus pht-3B]|uniref:DUF4376 domain-containing protein n=2 Tax=Nitratireductor TaxID=245876 RepID=K2M4P0_9HYPH|nr:hypothetical protein NA2_19813 [Nitratireductor pacificus pht-3B]
MILEEIQLTDAGPVNLRFADGGAFFREVRLPGAAVDDLPTEAQSQIAAHWTPARIAAFEAARMQAETDWQAELNAMRGPTTGVHVNAERERRISRGRAFSVSGYGDVPLTGRGRDQLLLMGLLVKAQTLVASGVTDPVMTVRDANNLKHILTPAQMVELLSAGMAWIEAVMAVSWAMKDGDAPFEAGIPEDVTSDQWWP